MAKDLARRSGMTLGEWLNQMIIDGDAEPPPPVEPPRAHRVFTPPDEPFRAPLAKTGELQALSRALDGLAARLDAAEQRSVLAISGIDQSVSGVLSRLEAIERERASDIARFEEALQETGRAQRDSDETLLRMEQAELVRAQDLKALHAAIAEASARSEQGDARFGHALDEVRIDLSNTARRLDRTEAKVESRAEANAGSGAVEAALSALSARLTDTETQTTQALSALQTSVAGLQERFAGLVADPAERGVELDRRLGALAADLAAKVEASRLEIAEGLRAAAGGRVEEMERHIAALADQVEKAEHRSAEAMERMGREVLRMASSLGERVNQVEGRSAQAVKQFGGEMARMANAIEQRAGRFEAAQAQALEKLGGEISRMAEKLAEKIIAAERRAAQSVDDVGDQLGRVTERMNQRYERAQSELGERIRQSEERTAKVIAEAQSKLEARLTQAQQQLALDAAAEKARKTADAELEAAPHAAEAFDAAPDPFATGSDPADDFGPDPFAESLTPFAGPPVGAGEGQTFVSPPPIQHDAFSGLEGFPPAGTDGPGASTPRPAARAQQPAVAALSTREMLEQARAAARGASEGHGGRSADRASPGSVEAPPLDGEGGGFSFGLSKRKKKEGVTIRTALLASGTAAALAVTGAGAVLLVNSEMSASSSDRPTDHFGAAPTAALQPESRPAAPPTAAAPSSDPGAAGALAGPPSGAQPADQAAVALTGPAAATSVSSGADPAKGVGTLGSGAPTQTVPTQTVPTQTVPTGSSAQMLYSSAVRRIEGGDLGGVEELKRSANLGDAAAEFYLARLYETGGAGLSKDLATARRWTERAAMAGDVAAMHNLGLYFYEGDGGPQDPAQAARWFRRAAEQGVRDSQFNLALLYAKGYGVPRNLAEAYKWYLIAAAEGDDGARKSAADLRSDLSPESAAAAERAAAGFRIQTQAALRTGSLTQTP